MTVISIVCWECFDTRVVIALTEELNYCELLEKLCQQVDIER